MDPQQLESLLRQLASSKSDDPTLKSLSNDLLRSLKRTMPNVSKAIPITAGHSRSSAAPVTQQRK